MFPVLMSKVEGYAPPGARQEELSRDVSPRLLKDISCEEISVTSTSKVKLSGILVRSSMAEGLECSSPDTVIVYLQGVSLFRAIRFRHSSVQIRKRRESSPPPSCLPNPPPSQHVPAFQHRTPHIQTRHSSSRSSLVLEILSPVSH